MLKYYLRDTAFYRFMRKNDIEDFVYYGLIALAVFLSIYLIRKRLKFFGHDSTKLKRFFIITTVIVYPTALVGSRLPDMFYRPLQLWSVKRFFTQIWEANTYTFHGGVLFVTVILFCLGTLMKFTTEQKWQIADTIFLYIPSCHAIGRVSCLILGCCWGKHINLSVGGYHLEFRHPVPLYSIIIRNNTLWGLTYSM